jgi:KaiC/GvpD/RAD55 family RecA-like ATPase
VRRGQVTLVAAAPGGGKSAMATAIALHSGVPSIYFSADSDKMTFGARVMASALNMTLSEAEELLLEKDEIALQELDELTGHIWVSFDPAPTPKDIDEETDCFAYIYGDYPKLVVIDNLMDVALYGPDERSGHDAVIDYSRQLARKTGAAVLILCHVTGAYTDGNDPIPRSGLMNKIDKRPRMILTLYRYDVNTIGVCVVKNSNGPAASDGSMEVLIPWIAEKAWLGRDD